MASESSRQCPDSEAAGEWRVTGADVSLQGLWRRLAVVLLARRSRLKYSIGPTLAILQRRRPYS